MPDHLVALLDQLAGVGLDGEADDVKVRVALGVGFRGRFVHQPLADRAVLRAEDERHGLGREWQGLPFFSAVPAWHPLRRRLARRRRVHQRLGRKLQGLGRRPDVLERYGRLPSSRSTGDLAAESRSCGR